MRYFFPFLLITLYLAAPTGAEAQLVTCGGPGQAECNFCILAEMTNSLINWLFGFMTVVAVLILAAAGFKLVTSGGDVSAKEWAKARITYVIIGFLLMLASWLIVDTILRGLTGSENGMAVWGTFDAGNCGSQTEAVINRDQEDLSIEGGFDHSYEADIEQLTSDDRSGPDDGLRGGNSVVPTGNLVDYNGKKFDSAVVGNVREIASSFNLRVTGGHRTSERNRAVGGVANSNHLTGRAADFVGTRANMEAAKRYAESRGAREALIHDAGSGTHLHLAW